MAFSAKITLLTVNARFHLTVAICEVSEGCVNKGDTVSFFADNDQLLTTGTVSAINLQQKTVKSVIKGDEPLTVGLEFRDDFSSDISTAKYIIK